MTWENIWYDISRIGDGFVQFLGEPLSNVSMLVTLAGGIWVWKQIKKEDRFFPKIDFMVDVAFKVERQDCWIAEVVCSVTNRGRSRFSIHDLTFDLRGIMPSDDAVNGGLNIGHQTLFPDEIKTGSWFSESPGAPFAETGTTQYFRHVLTIPKAYEAVLLHGHLDYSKKLNGTAIKHSSDQLVRVPQNRDDALPLGRGSQGLRFLKRIERNRGMGE